MKSEKRKQNFFGHCPLCGSGYDTQSIEVLRKGEVVTLVHAECAHCRSSAVLMVLSGMLGVVTTIGMLTDMMREDVERFWNSGEITHDDVLVVHRMLEQRAW